MGESVYISKTLIYFLIYGVSNSSLHPLYGPGDAQALSESSLSSADNMGGKMTAIISHGC